ATTDEPAPPAGRGLAPLEELVQRAEQGDASALPGLRRFLDANPQGWQQYGDLALQAQAASLALGGAQNLLLHQAGGRKVEELRGELAGPAPSALEGLLGERVVACWLQTMYADAVYAQARKKESTPAARQELMKRQESSQRRYLAAVKQLVLVRKLLRPAVSPVDVALRVVPGAAPVARSTRVASPREGVPVFN